MELENLKKDKEKLLAVKQRVEEQIKQIDKEIQEKSELAKQKTFLAEYLKKTQAEIRAQKNQNLETKQHGFWLIVDDYYLSFGSKEEMLQTDLKMQSYADRDTRIEALTPHSILLEREKYLSKQLDLIGKAQLKALIANHNERLTYLNLPDFT